jgi:hypothetical protein
MDEAYPSWFQAPILTNEGVAPSSASVNSDIKPFLQTRLGEIATRRSLSISGRWPLDEDITTVLKKTSGLFIIASVIVRFIDHSYASPQERLKLIVNLPNSTIYKGKTGIDVLYHQIFSASFANVVDDDKRAPEEAETWGGGWWSDTWDISVFSPLTEFKYCPEK